MKLPDFYIFEPLNDVKKKMGIPNDVYGTLTIEVEAGRLTELELEKLTSTSGLDVSLHEVTILDNGTLGYKNSRVLLYIRDVTAYGTHDIQPRYHLSNCSTLRQMRERNRFERYVVASRTDGRFELNIIGHKIRREVHELSVCQNCLAFLDFNSFNMTMPATERRDRVRAFSLEDFFTKYPRSLHQVVPSHNSDNAPINTYSDDFEHISGRVRALGGWRCSECGIELSAPGHRKWLHVHHRNGLRHDNRRENLKVICFACHAEEADHSHMKNHPDYLTFVMVRMHIRGPR